MGPGSVFKRKKGDWRTFSSFSPECIKKNLFSFVYIKPRALFRITPECDAPFHGAVIAGSTFT